jgi:hypothetical protein
MGNVQIRNEKRDTELLGETGNNKVEYRAI